MASKGKRGSPAGGWEVPFLLLFCLGAFIAFQLWSAVDHGFLMPQAHDTPVSAAQDEYPHLNFLSGVGRGDGLAQPVPGADAPGVGTHDEPARRNTPPPPLYRPPPPPPPPPPVLVPGRKLPPLQAGHPNKPFIVTLSTPSERTEKLLVAPASSDESLREAIAAAVHLRVGTFALKDPTGVSVAISAATLDPKTVYSVVALRSVGQQVGEAVQHVPAKLPTVVFCSIATGRYRQLGLKGLASARQHFGYDCHVRLFLLTDNVTGVDPVYNPCQIPYRAWPQSGLKKFHDMVACLESELDNADYFYFLDADIQFEEDVMLGDIAGDMVGVEHPMYPRFDKALCGIKPLCGFPYDRNPRSHAYIPKEFGKFGPGFDRGNWYYLQSAFWGGRVKFAKPALLDLKARVAADEAQNVMSMTVQDERYVNWYFWNNRDNKEINLRILGHSFLFPGKKGAKGFGAWLHNTSRPIVRHVDKAGGHLPVGELEIESIGNESKCLDPYLPNAGIGIWGCHKYGDTQAWFWTKDKPLLESHYIQRCIDATGLKHHDAVFAKPCNAKNKGQRWRFDLDTKQIINEATSLCLTTSKISLQNQRAIGVKTCNPDSKNQKWSLNKREGAVVG